MKTLRNFICYNQKQLIKYEYTISQLHKKFKDSYLDSAIDKTEVQHNYEDLIIESFDMLEDIYSKNAKYIEEIFNIDDTKVRITIKMLLEDKESLIDIYRNHNTENNNFSQTSVRDNTGFKDIIIEQKPYYINDDIKTSFLKGDYKNHRLKDDCITTLKNNQIQWKNCWKGYGLSDDIKENNYYQSTLIIPMSITNTEEDKNKYSVFYKHFFEENITFVRQRTIWGFLCIDTIEKNYFEKMENSFISPIDYGFIFSDILSLYLVFFHNYVISSETIKGYEDNL